MLKSGEHSMIAACVQRMDYYLRIIVETPTQMSEPEHSVLMRALPGE